MRPKPVDQHQLPNTKTNNLNLSLIPSLVQEAFKYNKNEFKEDTTARRQT
jgi:hypothetical protein